MQTTLVNLSIFQSNSDLYIVCCFSGHNHPIWCITESSTGLYMATGSHDMSARLWSTDRNHSLQKYIGHTQDVDVRFIVAETIRRR